MASFDGICLRWSIVYLPAPLAYWVVQAFGGGQLAAAAYLAVAAAGAALVVARAGRATEPELLGLAGRPSSRDIALGTGGFLIGGTLWPLVEATGLPMFWDGSSPAFSPDIRGLLLTVLGGIVAASFAEEVWFRGVLLGGLLSRGWRPMTAVVVSSLIFGSLHLYGGPGFAVFTLLWAVVPAALFLWSHRLWAPIVAHALNNAWGHLAVPLLFG